MRFYATGISQPSVIHPLAGNKKIPPADGEADNITAQKMQGLAVPDPPRLGQQMLRAYIFAVMDAEQGISDNDNGMNKNAALKESDEEEKLNQFSGAGGGAVAGFTAPLGATRDNKAASKKTLNKNAKVAAKSFGNAKKVKSESKKRWHDKLDGGLSDRKNPGDFNKKMLKLGMMIELEHTDDEHMALEIVMDHLIEDPKYYIKLRHSGL